MNKMERLYYEIPSLARREEAIDYIQEHYQYNSRINGSGSLHLYLNDYEGWLEKLDDDRTRKPTEQLVPAETYFLIRESDNRIIGMVNIRLCLNERLKHAGGHIGYGIRPTERQKGYNKINLYLALQVCQEHGIEEAMLTCDKVNLASSRTMLALGGRLVEEFDEDGITEQKYIINVHDSLEKYREIYEPHIQKRR